MDCGGNMVEFNLERFINEKIAINCETKEQVQQFAEILKNRQFKNKKRNWSDYTISDGFNYFSNKLCFHFNKRVLCYADDYIYKERGFKIVKFEDLIFNKGVGDLKTFEQFAKSNIKSTK